MKEIRPSLESDQEETEVAYQLLIQLIQDHPEIELTLWAGAFFSCIVNGYKSADVSYQEFCQEIERAKKFYKPQFD